MKTTSESNAQGTRYKFVVASAEQAATVIRERLGDNARVLSVRTVPSTGLKRLWSAPMLEVVAQVDAVASTSPALGDGSAPELAHSGPARTFGRSAVSRQTISSLLRRSGLSELSLGRLESDPEWATIAAEPLHRGLVSVSRLLRREGDRRSDPTQISRAAFIGTPGSGRTTALCKWLGLEVFRRARIGHVVTAEFDRPNPAGVLPVFCEAMGVPVARFPASTEPALPGGFVYFDLPGISLRNPSENLATARFLDQEKIEHRILVLNAAYDHATLRAAYSAGRNLGATHLVFTHLDEVSQWGRLWDYLGDGGLKPLFLGTGPSLTGDCEDDVWSALIRRTLAGADLMPAAGLGHDELEEPEEMIP